MFSFKIKNAWALLTLSASLLVSAANAGTLFVDVDAARALTFLESGLPLSG